MASSIFHPAAVDQPITYTASASIGTTSGRFGPFRYSVLNVQFLRLKVSLYSPGSTTFHLSSGSMAMVKGSSV